MKIVTNILLTISLAVGALAAATAYVVPIDGNEERLEGRTLNAPAGVLLDAQGRPTLDEEGDPVNLAESGERLNQPLLNLIRSSGDTTVRVKEFRMATWSGRWYFLFSMIGLAVGAYLVQRQRRIQINEALGRGLGEAEGDGTSPAQIASPANPVGLLHQMLVRIAALQGLPVDGEGRQEGLSRIVQVVGELQRELIPPFLDARPMLVARFGLSSYAQLMNQFAAAERQCNRAWSAAADGVAEEAAVSISRARQLLSETHGYLAELHAAGGRQQ